MPRLWMRQTVKGSPDGVTIVSYQMGEQDVPESLARVFLREGWAESVSPPSVQLADAADRLASAAETVPAASEPVDAPVVPAKPKRAPRDKAAKAPARRKTHSTKARKK